MLLQTDTSDVDELYESSGVAVDAEQARATSSFPALVGDLHSESGHSDIEQDQYRKTLSTPRELSATGKATIRKYFSANKPIDLPIGHRTIAFSETHIHQVLRTIADERVISSFHMMKSLLLQAQSGKVTDKSGKQLKKAAATSRYRSFSTDDGETSDEYSSEAINSDDEPGNLV